MLWNFATSSFHLTARGIQKQMKKINKILRERSRLVKTKLHATSKQVHFTAGKN